MSILAVNEIAGASSREDEKGATEYTRKFRVVTANAFVGSAQVRLALGVPRIGDVYATQNEFDSGAIACEIRDQQEDDNPKLWTVDVTYRAPTVTDGQGGTGPVDPNPLLRPSVISWGTKRGMRAVWKDASGKGILNSAGEYFDPPMEMECSWPLLTISRAELSYSQQTSIDYQDCVNADSFFGFAPGKCKVSSITANSQTENGHFHWQVQYEFEFNRDGWRLEPLNQGRNYLNDSGDLVPLMQLNTLGQIVEGLPVPNPVPLDLNGKGIRRPTPSNVTFGNFKVYPEKDFAPLRLP